MPRGKQVRVAIPEGAKFAIVDGQPFVRVREAAKLAGIHPVVLEMAGQLIQRVGGSGAAFALATPDLQKQADAIRAVFVQGLRRYAKSMEPNKKLKVKVHRDGGRLVFWYSA